MAMDIIVEALVWILTTRGESSGADRADSVVCGLPVCWPARLPPSRVKWCRCRLMIMCFFSIPIDCLLLI